MKKLSLITVRQFAAALVKAGVLDTAEGVRRIVIDADADNVPVLVYVEYFADERLLDAVLTLDGVKITETP